MMIDRTFENDKQFNEKQGRFHRIVKIYLFILLLITIRFLFFDNRSATAQVLPIFPGAEGFGSATVAGSGRNISPYSTKIYKVTNVKDSGSGSLRLAIEKTGPRVIIFEVAGTIELLKKIIIRNPFLTIAGQTAPSPGITIKNYGLILENTHDVLIQHLRIRVGDTNKGMIDAMSINSAGKGTYNIVIDHVSVSWWQDGGIDFYASKDSGSQIRDVTISNSIISERLNIENHALATALGDNCHNISLLRNLWAHNCARNPAISGNTSTLLINNISYNSMYYGTVLTNTKRHGPHVLNMQGCIVIEGPDSINAQDGLRILSTIDEKSKIYAADLKCLKNGRPWPCIRNDTENNRIRVDSPPISISPMTILPSSKTKELVLSRAGARPVDRDSVDKRTVTDVFNGTGKIIKSQDDVGGWPTFSKNIRQLTPPTKPCEDDDGDGYTNLEEWLQIFARKVELN